jgi:hypothetical protein
MKITAMLLLEWTVKYVLVLMLSCMIGYVMFECFALKAPSFHCAVS